MLSNPANVFCSTIPSNRDDLDQGRQNCSSRPQLDPFSFNVRLVMNSFLVTINIKDKTFLKDVLLYYRIFIIFILVNLIVSYSNEDSPIFLCCLWILAKLLK